jgi:hypothetical protein
MLQLLCSLSGLRVSQHRKRGRTGDHGLRVLEFKLTHFTVAILKV